MAERLYFVRRIVRRLIGSEAFFTTRTSTTKHTQPSNHAAMNQFPTAYTLEISTTEHNGVAIISLVGEIDAQSAPILESEIIPITRRYERIILDLTGIHSVSGIGLRLILMLYRRVKFRDGQILLAGINDTLRRIIWAAGFSNYFIIAESLEAALVAFD